MLTLNITARRVPTSSCTWYRNMAPNVATQPTTLIDYIKSGSRLTVTMAGKQLSLYDLPEATSTASNPIRAYLFGMNQHSVQLYLRDSSVPFESMMAAMNSSVPPIHSAASLRYLGPMQIAARMHLSDPAKSFAIIIWPNNLKHSSTSQMMQPYTQLMSRVSTLSSNPANTFIQSVPLVLTCLPALSTYHVPPSLPSHFLSLSNQPKHPDLPLFPLLLQLVLKL